ncbi:MAG: TetR/AcrR family transcriptional regulator [Solirubrobacteraceae bacterium]
MPTEQQRERALRKAGDLFYAEGINATGVARVAQALGMSKRTLYELFRSKDELVAEALAARDEPIRREFFDRAETSSDDAAEQLVAAFSTLDQMLGRHGFNGCPFLRASAEIEGVNATARVVIADHKDASRQWMEDRARVAGLRDPVRLSHQLMFLFDGVLAHFVAVPDTPAISADTARVLVDAARS